MVERDRRREPLYENIEATRLRGDTHRYEHDTFFGSLFDVVRNDYFLGVCLRLEEEKREERRGA